MAKVHEFKLRARYSEIDGMKRVHNSVYQTYFEEARIDLVRSNYYPYEEMERDGIMFPVSEAKLKYMQPIIYDEFITVKVTLAYIKNFSIKFNYLIVKEDGSIASEGYTIHACVNIKSGRLEELPLKVREIMEPYLE